jgi:hypothetical protein
MMIAPVGWLRWKLPESSEAGRGDGARGIGAAAVAMVAVLATGATGRAMLEMSAAAPALGSIVIVGNQIPTGDAWTERLSDPSAWRGGRYISDRRGRRPMRPGEEPPEDADDEDRPPELTGFNRGTYRTVCVRLCDGYFFPISFATTPENFARDADACNARCGSPARLYVYPNPGGEPEQMVGLDGKPYSALKSAFLFRTNYDAACTCKPQPWSQEALARHRAFADAQKKVGTRTGARTIRSDQIRTDAASDDSGAAQGRPQGAMLLGADQPQPRAPGKSDVQTKAGNRTGGSSGGRSDWQRRAFTGD